MKNVKLVIAYDGTNFLGWQKTKMGPSIEETLELALTQILQHSISLQAASRTDAGVHATGQTVNFFTKKDRISLTKLKAALNRLLPKDIVVMSAEEVPEAFHPTLDCASKEYHYHLCYGSTQLPEKRLYSWHYPCPLDIEEMRQAVPLLLGERNFSSFCNTKKNEVYSNYIRNLQSIEIVEEPNSCLCFKVIGTHFLYKMVRNLVGTLVYVGRGKIKKLDLPTILAQGNRTLAGITAPAHGLFLQALIYRT